MLFEPPDPPKPLARAFSHTPKPQVVFIDGDFVLFEPPDSIFAYGEEHYDAGAYWVAAVPNR